MKDKNGMAPTPNLLLPASLTATDKYQQHLQNQQQIVEEVASPSFQQHQSSVKPEQAALAGANAATGANNTSSETTKRSKLW